MRSTSRTSGVGRRVIRGLGYKRSARVAVDELRDSTPARFGIDAGGPAGEVERLPLPGSGEVLLDVAVVPGGADRVVLALVAIELEETVTPILEVLEPGYFRSSALPAVHDGPAKIADVQVRRRLDQGEHFDSLRGPKDRVFHPLPLSLCSLVCVRHGTARCQVTRDTPHPATRGHCSLASPTFRTHDATLHAPRPDRGDLHLPAHHPRRHRPDHRIGPGLRRALAPLQRQAAPTPRPPDDDRVRAPAGRGSGERVGDGPRSVRLVAEAPPSTALHRPPPPRGGGVRRADVARPSGGVGSRDREAQPPAMDGDPAPRDGDALARDIARGRAPGDPDPGLAPGGT